MKMNCLSRFLPSSKSNKTSSKESNSSLAVATKQKSNNTVGRAQNIYKYYNSLVSSKSSESSLNTNITNTNTNSLNFNNNNNNKSMVMSGDRDRGSFYPSPSILNIHSPGGMETLSSPSLTSTPAAADSLRLLDGYLKLKSLDVCYMPDVVLDKIFSKLTDEDIRRVYQVSRSWRNAVLKRPSVNRRREEFVEKIRQNKENIIKGKQDLIGTDGKEGRRDRICDVSNNSSGKPGSRRVLNDYSNQMTLSFTNNNSSSVGGGERSNNGFITPVNSSTPTSRFSTSQQCEEWEQAERNLKEGQRLFRCKKCYGPVASPVASTKTATTAAGAGAGASSSGAGEEVSTENNGTGISIVKCRLTSRMSSIEGTSVKVSRERKKQRSLVKSSPASFPSTYVDICSLGEIMAKRLNISQSVSTPEVAIAASQSSRQRIIPMMMKEEMKKANSSPAILSSSTNTGINNNMNNIDLPISMINNNSGSVNVSNLNFDFSCSTESIYFNSPSPQTNLNNNNNRNRRFSPELTSNDNSSIRSASRGSQYSQYSQQALSSQNLSDSGFSMSYINSDDDFNESHRSTIFTPEPVRKIFEQSGSPSPSPCQSGLNRSEGMQFGSSDCLLRQAVTNNLKNNASLNVQQPLSTFSSYDGHNNNNNSNSIYDFLANKGNADSMNEFRVPAHQNDASNNSNVNQSLDPMLDSQSQQLYNSNSNNSDLSNRSAKTSSYSHSLLRDASASTNRSSLLQSPAFCYKDNSIRSESSPCNSNFFPKATFGISQPVLPSPSPSLLGVSGSSPMMNRSSSVNLNDSIILECPRPDCSFRFCSICEESEHIGKPCRVIDSDSFRNDSSTEEYLVGVKVKSPFNINNSGPNSNSNSKSTSSMCSKGKGSAKEESKKRLRRIARK